MYSKEIIDVIYLCTSMISVIIDSSKAKGMSWQTFSEISSRLLRSEMNHKRDATFSKEQVWFDPATSRSKIFLKRKDVFRVDHWKFRTNQIDKHMTHSKKRIYEDATDHGFYTCLSSCYLIMNMLGWTYYAIENKTK